MIKKLCYIISQKFENYTGTKAIKDIFSKKEKNIQDFKNNHFVKTNVRNHILKNRSLFLHTYLFDTICYYIDGCLIEIDFHINSLLLKPLKNIPAEYFNSLIPLDENGFPLPIENPESILISVSSTPPFSNACFIEGQFYIIKYINLKVSNTHVNKQLIYIQNIYKEQKEYRKFDKNSNKFKPVVEYNKKAFMINFTGRKKTTLKDTDNISKVINDINFLQAGYITEIIKVNSKDLTNMYESILLLMNSDYTLQELYNVIELCSFDKGELVFKFNN